MPVLHAGGGRAAVGARRAAVARGAGAAGARVRGGRRGQGAADGRRAHAAQRPGRRGARAARAGGRAQRGAHHQRAGADAPPARAAARRPGRAQRVAGLAARRPLRAHGAPPRFNDDEICDFVEYTRERDVEVRFIEFMPFSGNKWDDSKLVPYRAALKAAAAQHALEPAPPRPNDTATVWRVPGYRGSVGFISSMTQHFCSSCNRLRLTADGNLKVCLFGASEVSLRDSARGGASDAQLLALVRAALRNKRARHAARSGGPPARQSAGLAWAPRREPRRAACRAYCSAPADDDGDGAFSHLDAQGRARMVDVGGKPVTARAALAECRLHVGGRLLRLLRDARLPKGDALTVAQLAGALGAKRTAELIPLCHPLALDVVRVRVALPPGECAAGGAITLRCEARATGRTGVEMEALTGCAVAALALYDMCKSVDRDMRISELRVLRKTGGRSDAAPAEPPAPLRKPRAPDAGDETYAPTNFMHF
ncbi:molybdenum cofactor biosynthesis protein 1 isoform X3 [Helicoverpa armigera]|uniref:molybdenum cofactor biosynthesis protein 1 isoform X3 n=1 Tax=Helicoverpa armigera TaxID=29058 RepID=UPI003083D1C8